jgi:hypothetical protein
MFEWLQIKVPHLPRHTRALSVFSRHPPSGHFSIVSSPGTLPCLHTLHPRSFAPAAGFIAGLARNLHILCRNPIELFLQSRPAFEHVVLSKTLGSRMQSQATPLPVASSREAAGGFVHPVHSEAQTAQANLSRPPSYVSEHLHQPHRPLFARPQCVV